MLLNDRQIIEAIRNGDIQVMPGLRDQDVRPTGLRVHLATEILVPRPGQTIDLEAPTDIDYERVDLRHGGFELSPNCFVLAGTIEKVKLVPDLLMTLEGRSTIARLGITIHNTASILDGKPDQWFSPVLEIANHGPLSVILRPGVPIGMLCFQRLSMPASLDRFHGQYADQTQVRPANLRDNAALYALQGDCIG